MKLTSKQYSPVLHQHAKCKSQATVLLFAVRLAVIIAICVNFGGCTAHLLSVNSAFLVLSKKIARQLENCGSSTHHHIGWFKVCGFSFISSCNHMHVVCFVILLPHDHPVIVVLRENRQKHTMPSSSFLLRVVAVQMTVTQASHLFSLVHLLHSSVSVNAMF